MFAFFVFFVKQKKLVENAKVENELLVYSQLLVFFDSNISVSITFVSYNNATKANLLGILLTEDEDEFVFQGEKHKRGKQTHNRNV